MSAPTALPAGQLGNHLPWLAPSGTGAVPGGGLDLLPRKRPPRVAGNTRPTPDSRKERCRP